MTSLITLNRNGATGVVTLSRPEKLNALSQALMSQLTDTLHQLALDQELRAVIITGAGDRAFSVGTDIAELSELDESRARETAERGQSCYKAITEFPVPVIAAVNGIAAGGGCELVLACHLRVATGNAAFSLPETKLGMIPAYGGTQGLAHEIGLGRAIEMMLTGRVLTAAEALSCGMINRVVAPGELITAVETLANEIGALAPLAIRACLKAVTQGFDLRLSEGLALEAQLFASLFNTQDVREGTRAFLEKRQPVFSGK